MIDYWNNENYSVSIPRLHYSHTPSIQHSNIPLFRVLSRLPWANGLFPDQLIQHRANAEIN
ncbi:MAG: hypothetical protein MUC94_16085, partial [bacterium]|nr:hypothetical protein [bacterium]